MKRIISLLLVLCITVALLAGCSDNEGADKKNKETLTLMVYMVGSDLESKSMAASNDIVEMLESGLNTEDVSLVVFTGGAPMWHNDIPADVNATFIMGADDDGEMQMLPVTQTETLKNMGDSATFTGFLNDTVKAYPADHYGLICWNHGNGPLMGFGSDINFKKDKMDLQEMQKAFDASPFNSENKLDFIGFDACLMSSIEVANTLGDYARYMIASQEKEPGGGWDYSFLSVLNDTYDVPEIAESILTSYGDYYEKKQSENFHPDITLSCMDLAKADAVNTTLGDLLGAMETSLKNGDYTDRAIERSRVKTFGDASYANRGMSLDLVDLGSLAEQCESAFGEESAALKEALNEFVIKNKSNLSDANGVSMYYPYYGTGIFKQMGSESYQNISESSEYRTYIESFVKTWSENQEESEQSDKQDKIAEPQETDEGLTFELTDKQKSNLSRAYLNIFSRNADDGDTYKLLLLGSVIEPDEDGNITISANEKVPTYNGRKFLPLVQRGHNRSVTGYKTLGVGLAYRMYDNHHIPAELECSIEAGKDDILIKSINLVDDEENGKDKSGSSDNGKSSIDSERWECLLVPNLNITPARDKNGNMCPVSEWEWKISNSYNIVLNEDNRFAMLPIDKVYGVDAADYYYQIVLEDVSGNQTWSELGRFKNTKKPREFTQKTSLGTYTYQINDEYATLIKYEGKDKELTVPHNIDGVPVKYIARDAFADDADIDSVTIESPDIILQPANLKVFHKVILPEGLTEIPPRTFLNAKKLEEIYIPDSVTSIGSGAFGSLHLKKLELPAGLNKIGCGAFKGTVIDEGITFRDENKNFEMKDDFLLTKDGKTLLAILPSSETDIEIPDGVEEIAPHVHAGGEYNNKDYTLKHISFPESLKRIRYSAFEGDQLEELIFPDGLEEIGHYAFDNRKDSSPVNTIQFGSKLSWLGYCMLGDGRYRTLKIADKNRYYSVMNNRLMNKHGDADLSDEAALSQTDNIAENQSEYEAFLAATDGLDLNLYNFSADEQDIKECDGNTYSLKLLIKDKQKANFPGADITLGGKPLTMPFSYEELMQTGLKLKDEKDAKEKIKGFKTIYLLDDKDNTITARFRGNFSSEVPIEDCDVDELDLNPWALDDEPMSIDFAYKGVTAKSEIKDVFQALGRPSEITLSNIIGSHIRIYYTYCAYENVGKLSHRAADGTPYVPTSSFRVCYRYYPDTKKINMKEASLYLARE